MVKESSLDTASWACGNYTELTESNSTCFLWNYLFSCLAVESDWRYYNGGVYAPYAWVQESVVYDKETADGIKMIYDIREMGYAFQMWTLVACGTIFAMLLGLLYAKNRHEKMQAAETGPLLMPEGSTSPLTNQLLYDSQNSNYDSRGSAGGVSMRVTSKDQY